MKFRDSFIFGTATSAYQIEGAWDKDNKSPSIWDTFCDLEGKIEDKSNGKIACDHYHNYKEDIKLLKELGIDSYRFSISWSRIVPQKGQFNEAGINFYKSLINTLKENSIKPVITLYHWDLPLWAHNEGGWNNRECVNWFYDYAKKCFEVFASDVDCWITHNEPHCAGFLGYYYGIHAPGITDLSQALRAIHHILLSHGKVVQLFREMKLNGEIGIVLNLSHIDAKTNSFSDWIAKNNIDGLNNRWFLDSIFKGKYPVDMVNLFSQNVKDFSFIQSGDMEIISIKNDFLGINYYTSDIVSYDKNNYMLFHKEEPQFNTTASGWAITPEKLYTLIRRIRDEYTKIPIMITENGIALDDNLTEDKQIHDQLRIDYIKDHLSIIQSLNLEDMNITAYYLWSFMDNFEWSNGYTKRFGIVYIDYETKERIKKDSFYYYSNVIKNRRVD